jgi:hypothetical protein
MDDVNGDSENSDPDPEPDPLDPDADAWNPLAGPMDWESPRSSAVVGDTDLADGQPIMVVSSAVSDDEWIVSTAYFPNLVDTV